MKDPDMSLVRVSRFVPNRALAALIRRFSGVPSLVLFKVRWMSKLFATLFTRESSRIGMNAHMICKAVLPGEISLAKMTLMRLVSGMTSKMTQYGCVSCKFLWRIANLARKIGPLTSFGLQFFDCVACHFFPFLIEFYEITVKIGNTDKIARVVERVN